MFWNKCSNTVKKLCFLTIYAVLFCEKLVSQEILEAEEITISAESPEDTTAKTTITQEQIAHSGAANLGELLGARLFLPTLSYGRAESSFALRGFDSQRVAVIVDGVPVNSPLTGEPELSGLALNSIERIEVSEGGGDSKHNAGAFGGTVNIETAKPRTNSLSASLTNLAYLPAPYRDSTGKQSSPRWTNLVDTQNFALAGSLAKDKNGFTFNINGEHAENRFPYKDADNIARQKENNSAGNIGTSLGFYRDLPGGALLKLKAKAAFLNEQITRSGYSSDFDELSTRVFNASAQCTAPLLNQKLLGEFTLGYSYAAQDFGGSCQNLQQARALVAVSWYPVKNIALLGASDYHFVLHRELARHTINEGGASVALNWEVTPALLVVPSLQGAFRGTEVLPIPKLGVSWRFSQDFALKSNVFRMFKHPDLEDLYGSGAISGNPNLKSEDGWGGDLIFSYKKKTGSAQAYRPTIQGELAVFAEWTANSIHWYPVGNTWAPQNLGEAMFLGGKSSAKFDLPLDATTLSLALSYQYLESRLLTGALTWDSEYQVPYAAPHSGGFTIGAKGKTWHTELSALFSGSRSTNTDNTRTLPPYFLLNLHFTRTFGQLTLALHIRNLLNTAYETYADYPLPGTSLALHLTKNF